MTSVQFSKQLNLLFFETAINKILRRNQIFYLLHQFLLGVMIILFFYSIFIRFICYIFKHINYIYFFKFTKYSLNQYKYGYLKNIFSYLNILSNLIFIFHCRIYKTAYILVLCTIGLIILIIIQKYFYLRPHTFLINQFQRNLNQFDIRLESKIY